MTRPTADRGYSQKEAADAAGLHYSTLRDWLSEGVADLVSERRRGQRWFSVDDVLALKIANALVGSGFRVITAIATAFELVKDVDLYSVLIARPGGISTQSVHIATREEIFAVANSAHTDCILVIPAGRMRDGLAEALAKGAASCGR